MAVAVLAENGGGYSTPGKTETLDLDVRPPGERRPGTSARFTEQIDGELSRMDSVVEKRVEELGDKVRIRVSVRGENDLGAKGRFKAIYRVRWACGDDPRCIAGTACCNGVCVALHSDPRNCGACGTSCATGCCRGGCVDLPSDPNNCGACEKACESTFADRKSVV